MSDGSEHLKSTQITEDDLACMIEWYERLATIDRSGWVDGRDVAVYTRLSALTTKGTGRTKPEAVLAEGELEMARHACCGDRCAVTCVDAVARLRAQRSEP